MLILSLDSAADGCNICVWRDGQTLALIEQRMERGQDQQLMPLTLQALQQAQITFEQVDCVAVTRGPGSFTGLRIGLAAARGLGLALDKPVVGIDRFSIYREQFYDMTTNLLVVIQSKRKELYCRFYGGDAAEPMMLTPDEIQDFIAQRKNTILVGDASIDKIQSAREPEVVTCARLAAQADKQDPAFSPSPLYIRPPDVTMKAAVIKPLQPDQSALLAALHRECFGAEAWSEEQFKGSLAQPITQGWIASRNNESIGFVLCHTISHEVEILTIGVLPMHQGRGVAGTLLAEVTRIADAARSSTYLEVAIDNAPALALYKKAGFQQTGLRKGYYQRKDGQTDAVLLTRYS